VADTFITRSWPVIEQNFGLTGISFEDFVDVDSNLSAFGGLTDSEIIESIRTTQDDETDDDTEIALTDVALKVVTYNHSRRSIEVIRSYLEQASDGISPEVFTHLVSVENALDSNHLKSIRQTKITEFFKS